LSAPADAPDLLVLGAGPAGHKASIQAAKAGRSVLLVEREAAVGGECVQRGTIPSKTLHENARALLALRDGCAGALDFALPARTPIASLMRHLDGVRAQHERYLGEQLARNGVARLRGRARFISAEAVEVREPDGAVRRLRPGKVLIATGSRPRRPAHVPVDHEHVLDSDSILALIYLPTSLTVLGGGVIACEFASIFAALGVEVTLVDAAARPLGFLEPELSAQFVAAFERMGGRLLAGFETRAVRREDGAVVAECADGTRVRAEKLLCALGRQADVAELGLEAAGIRTTPRGHVEVDAHLRTSLPHVYAAGDVVGPPALAATAAEQGRRAVRHAFGLPLPVGGEPCVPVGIYTLPEIACVGLTEAEATARFGGAIVGRAPFAELARACINGQTDGLLKLVADPAGRVVGAQIVGASATELVHVAQLAIAGGLTLESFVEHVFNFPTMAEAYRVAALDACARMASAARAA
jgi:NAD(P) transhydrogenase